MKRKQWQMAKIMVTTMSVSVLAIAANAHAGGSVGACLQDLQTSINQSNLALSNIQTELGEDLTDVSRSLAADLQFMQPYEGQVVTIPVGYADGYQTNINVLSSDLGFMSSQFTALQSDLGAAVTRFQSCIGP